MEQPGFTSELHSSTSSPFSTRSTPISVIRSWAAFPPVVSESTNARVCGRSSAAAIERQQGIVQIGPPIAEHAPGVPVAAHLIQVKRGRQHGFADAIRFGNFVAGRRSDERRTVEGHGVLLALFGADAIR